MTPIRLNNPYLPLFRSKTPRPLISHPRNIHGGAVSFASVTSVPPHGIDQTISNQAPFSLENHCRSVIDTKKRDKSYRYFRNINRIAQEFPLAHSVNVESRVNTWCTNDYLGMGSNPKVLKTMHEVLDRYGANSGGSRNISGHNQFAISLEKTLAELHSKPAALYFCSGFSANDCALTVLGSQLPGCVFFSDASNHASIIEGIRHSGAKKLIWKHNDLHDLEIKLASIPRGIPKIVCFESIYSMCGTVGPIREIRDLAQKYDAITFLDEVHAVGLYGPHGAGIAEHLDFEAHVSGQAKDTVLHGIDIISGALGKGFGTMGGYITGPESFIDMVRSLSRGFIFTTAPAPATMAGAKVAIDFQRENPEDRMQLQRNVRAVKSKLRAHGLPVLPNTSHVVPLIVGDSAKCKEAADILFDEFGIYVQPINTPSVAVGQERLRISPTAAHTEAHQEHLVSALAQIWDRLGLRRIEGWKTREDGSVSEGWEEQASAAPVWTDAQLGITDRWMTDIVPPVAPMKQPSPPSPAIRHLEDTRIGW